MPIYGEPQVKAPDHNAFAANTRVLGDAESCVPGRINQGPDS